MSVLPNVGNVSEGKPGVIIPGGRAFSLLGIFGIYVAAPDATLDLDGPVELPLTELIWVEDGVAPDGEEEEEPETPAAETLTLTWATTTPAVTTLVWVQEGEEAG